MHYNDLKWERWGGAHAHVPGYEDAYRARVDFPNGYGVSVLRGGPFYTKNGTYELGVLFGGSLHYDNPVAQGDVLGYLTLDEMMQACLDVSALPPPL